MKTTIHTESTTLQSPQISCSGNSSTHFGGLRNHCAVPHLYDRDEFV